MKHERQFVEKKNFDIIYEGKLFFVCFIIDRNSNIRGKKKISRFHLPSYYI